MVEERLTRITPDIHEAVIAIAREAASAILQVYERGFEVEHKADHSPLTQADLAAHRVIAEGLHRLTPGLPLLSEEGAHVPWSVRQDWPTYWLVDPLDGTREFVKRNGEFTVNIALIEDHRPVFGVILAPVTGQVWHAQEGRDAFLREGETDRLIRVRRPASATLKVAASRSHRDPRTDALLARIGDAQTVALGSSLKFCRIAEGLLDVYPRFGPTCEWDTAAGQCILEAAGGVLLAPDGRAFRYNRRETLLNGDFMALGDATLPWRSWVPEVAAQE